MKVLGHIHDAHMSRVEHQDDAWREVRLAVWVRWPKAGNVRIERMGEKGWAVVASDLKPDLEIPAFGLLWPQADR